MGLALAQVVIANVNGLPADSFVNTFWFGTLSDPPSQTQSDEIASRLIDFYTTANTSAALGTYLGNCVSRGAGASTIKVYDGTAAPGLGPIDTYPMTINAAGDAQDLPWEVAVCISFKNDSATGIPAPNRRGRIFFGPINITAVTDVAGSVRPFGTFRTDAAVASERLRDSNTAATTWVVWSRDLSVASEVESGWIDDAFDTQRRRGEAVTTRTSWS